MRAVCATSAPIDGNGCSARRDPTHPTSKLRSDPSHPLPYPAHPFPPPASGRTRIRCQALYEGTDPAQGGVAWEEGVDRPHLNEIGIIPMKARCPPLTLRTWCSELPSPHGHSIGTLAISWATQSSRKSHSSAWRARHKIRTSVIFKKRSDIGMIFESLVGSVRFSVCLVARGQIYIHTMSMGVMNQGSYLISHHEIQTPFQQNARHWCRYGCSGLPRSAGRNVCAENPIGDSRGQRHFVSSGGQGFARVMGGASKPDWCRGGVELDP